MNFRNMMELGCTVMLAMAGAAIECHQRVLLPEDTCWEFGILTVFTILWSILCVLSRGNKGLALWGFPERTFARPFFWKLKKHSALRYPPCYKQYCTTIRLSDYQTIFSLVGCPFSKGNQPIGLSCHDSAQGPREAVVEAPSAHRTVHGQRCSLTTNQCFHLQGKHLMKKCLL